MTMQQLYLLIPLAPLAGAIAVGLFGPKLGRGLSHWLCILGVAVATVASVVVWRDVMAGARFNGDVYTWLQSGSLKLAIGFLIDPLTATMMLVGTIVSSVLAASAIVYGWIRRSMRRRALATVPVAGLPVNAWRQAQ